MGHRSSIKNEARYPPCECRWRGNNAWLGFSRIGGEVGPEHVEVSPLGFPDHACFSREFLELAGPFVQVGDGIITITVSNGRASYGIVGENLLNNTVCGVRSPA